MNKTVTMIVVVILAVLAVWYGVRKYRQVTNPFGYTTPTTQTQPTPTQ